MQELTTNHFYSYLFNNINNFVLFYKFQSITSAVDNRIIL